MKILRALGANLWWLAVASAIGVTGLVLLPWTAGADLLTVVLCWGGFLAVSGFLVLLALRRRELLRDRPSLSLALIAVCCFIPLSMFSLPELGSFGIYFMFGGFFHLASFLLLALLLVPIVFVRSFDHYLFLIERIALFSASLLFTGAVLNAVWMLLIYERFYYSQDTVIDCSPFIPFGQWVLDQRFGDEAGALLAGTQLWHLQALWALFALCAWGSAVLLYRRSARGLAA